MSLSLSGHDVITGSVSYLYQDGRIGTVGRYTGRLSSSGKLTVVFGDGKALAGAYGAASPTTLRRAWPRRETRAKSCVACCRAR
jgi:hypothetical protein